MNKITELICPFGCITQARMEEMNPGYCKEHCGKWRKESRGIHFLDAHAQQIECVHRFGIEECRSGSRAG